MAHSIFYINDKNKKNEKRLKSPELRQVTQRAKENEALAKAYKQVKASRKLLRVSVALVILVFAALLFLLYNQSRIIQVTAQNAEYRNEINVLLKENARRREEISKSLDLDKIKEEAERLGLQDPQESQIVHVKQDMTDQIIVNIHSANAHGVETQDEELAEILANVEGFFKTIH